MRLLQYRLMEHLNWASVPSKNGLFAAICDELFSGVGLLDPQLIICFLGWAFIIYLV